MFAAAGVDLLFLKGLTLDQLAYGTILTKAGWDLDLLIAEEQLGEAARLLREAGYALLTPAPADGDEGDGLSAWHRTMKDSVWWKKAFFVELHTAVTDHRDLLPNLAMDAPRQEVAIAPGVLLPTFARSQLFAYLCVHGASSAWFRLKWASDLAALIGGCSASDIEELYAEAQAQGAYRAAGLGLLMCHWLFKTPLPARLHAELANSRAHRRLFDLSVANLTGPAMEIELQHLRLGTLGIHRTQFLLKPGFRFKVAIGVQLLQKLRHRQRRLLR